MSERGFTLIEVVVAVAITAILLLGALWLFGMHPAALRASVEGFDQRYGAARALAAKTGNGATIVFAPRAGSGFTMSVYAGRPKDAASVSAMAIDAVPVLVSDADIAGPFGSPPFAVFLSSAGKPSGKGGYPAVSASGAVTFDVLAQQPSCPDTVNGIVFTFRGANGATDTRKIGCDGIAMLSGTAAPQPSMTPEALRIDTASMLAHWTSDSAPLHFKVGEFGYTHWFESGDLGVNDCGIAFTSDNGNAPAVFAPSPNSTSSPAEMSATPAPDANTPYTWATQVSGHPPDQPPGDFQLTPVSGNGGTCTVQIVDDHQQSVTTHVQVMGDLDPRVTSMTFVSPTDAAQSLTLGKTFDTEQLQLQFGGPCGGIVTESQTGNSVASSISTQATTATIVVTPVAAGACDLHVGDQYGEPAAIVHINVKSPQMKVIPQYIEYPMPPATTIRYPSGMTVGYRGMDSRDARVARFVNAALSGATATAGVGPPAGTPCYAINFLDAAYSVADGSDDSIFGTQGGCYVQNSVIPGFTSPGTPASAVEALGYNGEQFNFTTGNCGGVLGFGPWTNSHAGPSALLGESVSSGTTATNCTFYVGDQANRTAPVPVQAKLVSSVVSLDWSADTAACHGLGGRTTCSQFVTVGLHGRANCQIENTYLSDNGGTNGAQEPTIDNQSGALGTAPVPTSPTDWTALLTNTLGKIEANAAANGMPNYIPGQSDVATSGFMPNPPVTLDVSGCP